MFHFGGFPSLHYLIHVMIHGSSPCWFPNSEIRGSKLIYSSPQLIAVCHVLRRLPMPRHSPYALLRLNFLAYLPVCCASSLANNCCFLFAFLQKCSFPTFRKDLSFLTCLFSIICFASFLYSVFNELVSHQGRFSFGSLLMWWRRRDSNPLPLECHSSALPSELRPH